MNLQPTQRGLKILENAEGWFAPNFINFKYRVKNRKFILSWIYSETKVIAFNEINCNHFCLSNFEQYLLWSSWL